MGMYCTHMAIKKTQSAQALECEHIQIPSCRLISLKIMNVRLMVLLDKTQGSSESLGYIVWET